MADVEVTTLKNGRSSCTVGSLRVVGTEMDKKLWPTQSCYADAASFRTAIPAGGTCRRNDLSERGGPKRQSPVSPCKSPVLMGFDTPGPPVRAAATLREISRRTGLE